MQKINFENVGIVYKFWYSIFNILEQFSPFSLYGKVRRKVFHTGKSYSDQWVIGNFMLSMGAVLINYYSSLERIKMILVFYAFLRILEIVVYQINVLVFHPYRTLVVLKQPVYKLQNQYRSIVLLGHNFIEVIFWFTCVTIYFQKPSQRLLYTLMDNTINIFTFNYEKVSMGSQGIQIIFFFEVMCGMILTIISLAKFIGELPHVELELEKSKGRQK